MTTDRLRLRLVTARHAVVSGVVGCSLMMSRHTTSKFCLDPTVEQCEVLARHAGAARFAFNQCLGMVKTALTRRKTDPSVKLPWTRFDLINAFNWWKKTEDAGRVFSVDTDGVAQGPLRCWDGDAKFVSRCSGKPPWTVGGR
jgi:hypothetical protein